MNTVSVIKTERTIPFEKRKPGPVDRCATTETKRHFVTAWKFTFPWVFLDQENRIRCRCYIDAWKVNAFTQGCKNQEDMLTKHISTGHHKAALEAQSGRRDMQ